VALWLGYGCLTWLGCGFTALAELGFSCGFMAWVWLWLWLNCYHLVLLAEAQKWLMIVVLIYEG